MKGDHREEARSRLSVGLAIGRLRPTHTHSGPTTPTPVPVLATSAEEIVGTWRGEWSNGMYQRINEDGSWIVAFKLKDLETSPGALLTCRFEGSNLLLTEVDGVGDFPSCGTDTATYQVQLLEDGRIKFLARQDDCEKRRIATAQVHKRVE